MASNTRCARCGADMNEYTEVVERDGRRFCCRDCAGAYQPEARNTGNHNQS